MDRMAECYPERIREANGVCQASGQRHLRLAWTASRRLWTLDEPVPQDRAPRALVRQPISFAMFARPASPIALSLILAIATAMAAVRFAHSARAGVSRHVRKLMGWRTSQSALRISQGTGNSHFPTRLESAPATPTVGAVPAPTKGGFPRLAGLGAGIVFPTCCCGPLGWAWAGRCEPVRPHAGGFPCSLRPGWGRERCAGLRLERPCTTLTNLRLAFG